MAAGPVPPSEASEPPIARRLLPRGRRPPARAARRCSARRTWCRSSSVSAGCVRRWTR